jgi:CHASE2 domain-containing sensor protein
MRSSLFRAFFHLEFAFGAFLTLVLVWLMLVISDNLPDIDETSFLDPVMERLDFLNIGDVSIDAIFATRDAEFPDRRIKIINVGEVAPTPDGMIAMLLYKLHAAGARVIGIDIILDDLHVDRFPEHRRSEFDVLAQALHEIPNVVVVSGIDMATSSAAFHLHPDILEAGPAQGFANLIPDSDEVIRRFLPWATVDGERWLGFPAQVLNLYDASIVEPWLAMPEEAQIIYYTSTYHQFESIPLLDVVYGDMYDDSYFRDAIVLIGFVNEGGLFYLGDTHKTPMGRKIGIEGPDMPGILVHANIVNMMLKGRFITPVPEWVDWVLAFIAMYISIALYRALRTKARNRMHVAGLILGMWFVEAVIIFFLPLIAFFYFDIKISYQLMATGVFLFVPANAAATRLRFEFERFRMWRRFPKVKQGVPIVITDAFRDDEFFVSHMRLIHACIVTVQYAWAQHNALLHTRAQLRLHHVTMPGLDEWRRSIPSLDALFSRSDAASVQRQYFLRFLEGRRHEFLHESATRNMYFLTELRSFNPFLSFQEWELLLPHAKWLFRKHAVADMCRPLVAIGQDGEVTAIISQLENDDEGAGYRELQPGLYCTTHSESTSAFRLSPFCEWAECKVHRTKELFIFSAMVPRQHGLASMPVYYGRGPACEPILPDWTLRELRELEHKEFLHTEMRDTI